MVQRKSRYNKQRRKITRWILIILFWTFASAAFLSFISETILKSVNLIVAFILLIILIFIHLLFDLIGVAVTACSEVPFIAMAAKKIKGANQALNLVKNADKVANFCQDVIGDITGILSGSIGATIIVVILFKNPSLNQFLMSILMISTISAVTVTGKALAKNIALAHNVTIISKMVFFTIEKCAEFQPKTVPLNTKKLISSNPSFPPSFINNRHTFIYTGKIVEA